jgi:hypothetical protein
MFGGGELNASRYISFFGGRNVIFGWYTWAVVEVRRCYVDRYVKCDRLRRPRSFPNVILEDTRDICMRDVQLIEQKGILNKTQNEPLWVARGIGISWDPIRMSGCADRFA